MTIKPAQTQWGRVFAVPSNVIDSHIKLCSGVALKVLMLVYRYPDEELDEESIAEKLSLPRCDISDALSYWVQSGVLAASGEPKGTRQAAALCEEAADRRAGDTIAKSAIAPAARPRMPRSEVLELFDSTPQLASLLSEAQTILGKPFTSADMDSLASLYTFYHMSAHFIMMVMHYCVKLGRRGMAYIETTAVSWQNEGIDDATVDSHIELLEKRHSNEGKISAMFGIDRKLIPKERAMIARWTEEFGFESDVIEYAYQLAVERTGKLAFGYIDKILDNWHQKGISTLEQAQEEHRAPRNKNGQSSFDYSRLDALV